MLKKDSFTAVIKYQKKNSKNIQKWWYREQDIYSEMGVNLYNVALTEKKTSHKKTN
jgi:hypothetical protein